MDDDGFIKEKIDTLKKAESSCDVSVPDSLYEKCSFAFTNTNKTTLTNPIYKWKQIFSPIVAAVAIFIIMFCAIYFPNQSNNIYKDNFAHYEISIEELQESYNIITPNMPDSNHECIIYKNNKTKENSFCKIKTSLPYGLCETIVIMSDKFDFVNKNDFTWLPNKGSTSLFEYKYFSELDKSFSLATFKYNNYEYYLMFSSPTPENIIDILDSFSL